MHANTVRIEGIWRWDWSRF